MREPLDRVHRRQVAVKRSILASVAVVCPAIRCCPLLPCPVLSCSFPPHPALLSTSCAVSSFGPSTLVPHPPTPPSFPSLLTAWPVSLLLVSRLHRLLLCQAPLPQVSRSVRHSCVVVGVMPVPLLNVGQFRRESTEAVLVVLLTATAGLSVECSVGRECSRMPTWSHWSESCVQNHLQ